MMVQKKKIKSPTYSIKILVLFSLLVLFFIIISLAYRAFLVIKNSNFDTSYPFTLAIVNNSNKASVLSFDPTNKSIAALYVTGYDGKDSLSKVLGIPINSKVIKEDLDDSHDIHKLLFSLIMHHKGRESGLTVFDVLHLYQFAMGVSPNRITEKSLKLPSKSDPIDKIAVSLFQDNLLLKENNDVQIVNASGVIGLGNQLERMLSNIGGSIVSITASDVSEKKSKIIYYGEESYTADRFAHILHYPLHKTEKKSLFDIIIIIGTDSLQSKIF